MISNSEIDSTVGETTPPAKVARRRRIRLLAALAATAAAIIASVFVAEAPANASATGCTFWGPITIAGHSIPTGEYCFSINGSGLHVNNTSASLNTVVIYNYSEVVRFYNNSNQNYATFTEPTHVGAAYGYQLWSTNISGNAQSGRVCGTLTSSGVGIATVCENIFP